MPETVMQTLRPGSSLDARIAAAQIALAWVLKKGDDIVPIPSTRRIPGFEENIGATAIRLSPAEMAELESSMPANAIVGDRYGQAGQWA